MIASQPSLFDAPRHLDAALRARAWERCREAAAALDGTADRAGSLADCRLAKDVADGLAHRIADTSGNAFCGYGRGTPAGDAIEQRIRS